MPIACPSEENVVVNKAGPYLHGNNCLAREIQSK